MQRFTKKSTKPKIKFISFDMDGTLSATNFEELIWFREIPKLYAKKNKISFSEAKKRVLSEYEKIGDHQLEWYDVRYWFRKFGLKENHSKMMRDLRGEITLYKDTLPVLRKLKKRFNLVVISNASRDFLNLKMETEGLENLFYRIFSSTSDFKKVKKTPDVYMHVCKKLGVLPSQIIHIGDNYSFDYLVPKKAGIVSFYLKMKGKRSGKFCVRSLSKFEKRVSAFK